MPALGLSIDNVNKVSNEIAWWPLAQEVSQGNLFPATPSLDHNQSALQFFPYLSIWIHGLLIALVGLELTAWIGYLILPTVGFVFAVLVYNLFLPWRWAIALAALGFITFADVPFRLFLSGLVSGQGWLGLGTTQLPDLLHFPFPTLSIVMFLSAFYWTLKPNRLTSGNAWRLTFLWGIQSHIHIINGTISAVFWPAYLMLRLWRQDRGVLSAISRKMLLTQAVFFALLSLPTLITFFGASNSVMSGKNSLPESNLELVLIAYVLIPLIMIFILHYVKPIDFFEITSRFMPIWVLLGVEIVLIIVNVVTGFGPSPDLIFNRVGVFFIHLLPYGLVLYYMLRPHFELSRQTTLEHVRYKLGSLIKWSVSSASYVYLPVFFILLSLFAVASAHKAFDEAIHVRRAVLLQNERQVEALYETATSGVVMTETPAANLLIPMYGSLGSLWVNSFSNVVSSTEVIERLCLYAHLAGWDQKAFMEFMKPPERDRFSLHSAPVFLTEQSKITLGFGYWLTNHKDTLTGAELTHYMNQVEKSFSNLNISESIKKFKLSYMFVKEDRLPLEVKRRVKPVTGGYIIEIVE